MTDAEIAKMKADAGRHCDFQDDEVLALIEALEEARDVAKWLLYDSGGFEGDPYSLELKYPWLKNGD